MTLRILCFVLAALGVVVWPAGAAEYWIAYEGNDFPENEGWERSTSGGGAHRWIEDGALVIDSLHSAGIYDEYVNREISDPGPGEIFVAEWRVLSEEMISWYDAGVTVARSAVPGHVFFAIGVDDILIQREWRRIPIAPGEWHAYRIETPDMQEYTLWIDGEEVFTGLFEYQSFLQSYVAWGDRSIGGASLTKWDYLRFGVVPETSSVTCYILGAICLLAVRHR